MMCVTQLFRQNAHEPPLFFRLARNSSFFAAIDMPPVKVKVVPELPFCRRLYVISFVELFYPLNTTIATSPYVSVLPCYIIKSTAIPWYALNECHTVGDTIILSLSITYAGTSGARRSQMAPARPVCDFCLANTVDTFQIIHTRNILGTHWPNNINSIELYTQIQTEEWSTITQRRRLNWVGHLMRLHPETPARRAFTEYPRKIKRPKGRPQRTWLEPIKHALIAINVILDYNNPNQTIEQLTQMAYDINYWRTIVGHVVT